MKTPKRNSGWLALTAASMAVLLVVAIPVAASFYLARAYGIDQGMSQLRLLAADVERRAQGTITQIGRAILVLEADATEAPCSQAQVAKMRALDIGSNYLQAIGYVAGNELRCSSIDIHKPPIALGPPDFVEEPKGYRAWVSVELPFAPGRRFLVAEKGGYGAVVHHLQPVDVAVPSEAVVLAVFSSVTGKVLIMRGDVRPQWIENWRRDHQATFRDDGYLVAVSSPTDVNFATLAAMPTSGIDSQFWHVAYVMVPLGLLLGILLALVMARLVRQRSTLKTELQVALKRREFFLEYQPVIDLASGHCVGAEALIRWRRRDGSVIRPDVFIPIAEDCGLITQISAQVTEMVARDMADYLRSHPQCYIAINFSSDDLQSDSVLGLLRNILREYDIAPSSIVVEATERCLLNAEVAVDIVEKIRAMGIAVAIDDFGTGYSGLAYLTRYRFDYLKIDKAFVDTIGTDAATSHVVLHIIEMAKSLKLRMVAEGVETREQADLLAELGVQYAQGWLFSTPLPPAELLRHMARHGTRVRR